MALFSAPRFRPALLGIAAVLAIGALFLSPTAQTLANDVLSIFRVKRFVAVSFDPNQPMQHLLDLTQFGTFSDMPRPAQQTVSSAAEASRLAGFDVKLPQDPSLGEPTQIIVQQGAEATFTFDVARARAYLASRGETSFTIPDHFDGTKLTISVPPMVTALYGGGIGTTGRDAASAANLSATGRANSTVVIQGQSPSVKVEGRATLEELRNLLLSMPGLPPETVAQIRAIDDWTNTLPVPVPQGIGITQEIQVNGAPGLALADNTGAGGTVLWTRDNLVYAVAGVRTADELMRIASSIR